MTLLATSAFAPDFAHTSAGAGLDVELSFATGTSPVGVTIPSGTYRVCLAPAASDFLRVIAAAINAAAAGAGHTNDVVALTVGADGVLTFAFLGGVTTECDGVAFSAPLQRALGFGASVVPPVDNSYAVRGSRPVWYLALLSATKHGPWLPKQAGGTEQTTGGRVYAIAASATSWQRKHAVSFQPTTPAQRTAQGADATALLPAPEYMGALGSTATAREWSVLDVLQAARNAACGIAIDNWQTVRASTSERFWYGYVAGESLLSPALTAPDETWDAWADWTLGVVLPATGASITRA